MNEELAAETEAVRFTPVRLREGYDMTQVDSLLDKLVRRLRSGADVAEFVRAARFTPVRLREGYDMGEVDTFLDRVVQQAAAGAPAASSYAPGADDGAGSRPTGEPGTPDPVAAPAGPALNDDLVAKLRGASLPGSGLKEGYDKQFVDALLGRLQERLAGGRTFDDLLTEPRPTRRFGYDQGAVDELLDSVRYAARYA